MNKTLDINIANQIFHIDEVAYKILKKYLDDIKAYLSKEESRDEIIQDIEARIAELFIERMISDKQVINIDDVNEIIKSMGQPEDFDLSEDENQTSYRAQKSQKKLYRDKDDAYISGVSAGIAHYLDVKPIWIRLLWVLFTVFSTGWLTLVYIILWILVPEAKTTAEKLAMKGEPINLSNIEKKIKEGYENVSEKFKDVDVKKQSKKAQSSISNFFSQLEVVLIGVGKVLIKIIGCFLLLVSGIGLLALLFSALGISGIGLFSSIDFDDYVRMEGFINSIFPIWLIITSIFVSTLIPFLFIFIFSLKMLFSNIKRPSLTFIITMVSIWILSIATLAFAAINSEARHKLKSDVVETKPLMLKDRDTLFIKMKGNLNYTNTPFKHNESIITYDDENNKIIYDSDIDIKFQSTSESNGFVRISRWTWDYEEDEARNKSKLIEYQYEINNNQLLLDSYLLAPLDLRNDSRGVDVDIYIPDNLSISMNENVENFLKNRFENYKIEKPFSKLFLIEDEVLKCINCEEIDDSEEIIEESGNQNQENNVLYNKQ
jgi:phage shock protein PspC (stress-responsive transcriptional regulator)